MTTHTLAIRLLAAPEQEIGARGESVVNWLLRGLAGQPRRITWTWGRYGLVRHSVPFHGKTPTHRRLPGASASGTGA